MPSNLDKSTTSIAVVPRTSKILSSLMEDHAVRCVPVNPGVNDENNTQIIGCIVAT